MLRTLLLVTACAGAAPPPEVKSSVRSEPTAPTAPVGAKFERAELTVSVRGIDVARLRTDGTLELRRDAREPFAARAVIAEDGTLWTLDATELVVPRKG